MAICVLVPKSYEYKKLKTGWGGGLKSQDLFEEIISLDNLFLAWKEFKKGKSKKKDVQEFKKDFKSNLFLLHQELKSKTYKHSAYFSFYMSDPKLRHIHKAVVKDRVLHHAVFRILYPIFDRSFIYDSYSCRLGKGTHRAVNRLEEFARKVSRNNSRNCFVLKCDIKKYFDSISHKILIDLFKTKIFDANVIWLIEKIIKSYATLSGKGIPLGNITSQLFANIYLNELDKFAKHKLKIKYYIRYCDDFVILDNSKEYLESMVPIIEDFLKLRLDLRLHEKKIIIRKFSQGIDFLGYVSFPYNRILRNKTKKRMFRRLKVNKSTETLNSYLGVLKHCNSYKLILKLSQLAARAGLKM